MLASKGFWNQFTQIAEMSIAFAANVNIVALNELHEDFGHSNITIKITNFYKHLNFWDRTLENMKIISKY